MDSRPIPFRVETIGPWLHILELITHLAIVTNTAYLCLFNNCTWPYSPFSSYLPSPTDFLPSLCATDGHANTSNMGWFLVYFVISEVCFIALRSMLRRLMKEVFPSEAVLHQRRKTYESKQMFVEALREKLPSQMEKEDADTVKASTTVKRRMIPH